MAAPKFIHQILHFLLVVFILFILSIFILVVGIPSYIARFLVSRLARFVPDLGKMLTTKSSLPGVDDITGVPKQNLVIYFIVKGVPDFELGVRYVAEHAIDVRVRPEDGESSELAFPEMQQYVTRWGGFLFWKWDQNFDIYNHIRIYSQETVSEESYYEIGSKLTYAPFKAGQSPWEMFLFPDLKLNPQNYPEAPVESVLQPHFGVMMRVHHTLADGFSLTRMLNVDFGGKETINVQTSNFAPVGPQIRIWKKAAYLLKAPYDFVSESLKAYDGLSAWHVPEEQLERSHNASVSPAISMDYIKEIKNAHGVSFTSVLISAFTGAIRRFMDEANTKDGDNYVRPSRVHCIHPLPMPAHPSKLRNHMTACFIELPIDVIDPLQRLTAIEDDLTRAKNGTLYPIAMYYYMCLLGGLPAALVALFAKNTLCTAFMSNFPGDNTELVVAGYPLRSMYFAGGFTAGNIGMGFASISYNGSLRIVAGVDTGLVPDSVLPSKAFIEYFMAELEELRVLKIEVV